MKGVLQIMSYPELKYYIRKFAKSDLTAFILFISFTYWLFLLMIDVTDAFLVSVNVPQIIEGNITSIYYNSSTDLVKFRIEYQNRGSIPYTARIRIDVLNVSKPDESRIIFTAWGPEKIFMPGDKKTSELYWYNNETGNFTVRARVYYANEILENFFDIEKTKTTAYIDSMDSEVFQIKNLRVYDNFIVFDLFSKRDVEDIIIVPDSFTNGWIFEQKKIDLLKGGSVKVIALPYKPTVFAEDELTLKIVSEQPKIYYEKTFTLIKNRGLTSLIYYLIDYFKIILMSKN